MKLIIIGSFQYDLDNQFLGICGTRVYVVILALIVIVLVLYTSFTPHTRSITISTPSLAYFEELQATFPNTLSCACSKVEIPNSNMIAISPPRFHQVRLFENILPALLEEEISVANQTK